jgi:hypothetical protein
VIGATPALGDTDWGEFIGTGLLGAGICGGGETVGPGDGIVLGVGLSGVGILGEELRG